jgi:hypothetical protein
MRYRGLLNGHINALCYGGIRNPHHTVHFFWFFFRKTTALLIGFRLRWYSNHKEIRLAIQPMIAPRLLGLGGSSASMNGLVTGSPFQRSVIKQVARPAQMQAGDSTHPVRCARTRDSRTFGLPSSPRLPLLSL